MNDRQFRQRGFTMIEMMVALAILGATFVGIMVFMDAIAKGLYSESIEADQQTRMASRMFEMVSEIRQATPQSIPDPVSPATSVNIYTQTVFPFTTVTTPPSITFRLPTGTNSQTGQITWGNLIRYYLVKNNGKFIDAGNTVQEGAIWRDETTPAGETTKTVIEDHVPYNIPGEILDNVPATNPTTTPTAGTPNIYGFNVYVVNNTITISIHKTGDTRVNLASSANPTNSTNGTLATSIFTGTYTMRNPQQIVYPSSTNTP